MCKRFSMNNTNACTKFEKIFEEIDGIRDNITTTINGEKKWPIFDGWLHSKLGTLK